MVDGVMGLADLPSRGVLGVVDGIRPLPAAPGPAYVCCQQHSPSVLVRNPAVRLIDLYKLSRKRAGTTAGAAGAAAGTKRPTAQQQLDDRAAKRQQQALKGTAAAGGPPGDRQQQQVAAMAAGAAGLGRPLVQQQRTQHAQQPAAAPTSAGAPLSTRPNGNSSIRPAAAAAAAGPAPAPAPAGVCSSSKQLLQFTSEQLMLFSNKRLTELLRGCGCKVAGKKEDLVRRLLEHQRRIRKAAQGSSSGAAAPSKAPL